MKSQVIGLKVASAVFMCAALAHVVRLVLGLKVQVGSHDAGVWPSVVAIVVAAGLSVWLGTLACRSKTGAVSAPPKA
jgi:hypothetical protein